MKIYPFEQFHYKTFGGPPNQADWTPYLGKSYERRPPTFSSGSI